MSTSTKLIFFCGKMAAGKSTLARDLASRENPVLLVQDDFLDTLFPGEITDIPGFVKCSSRLKNALAPHVCALLSRGISVVLDFPGNTKAQRAWFRELIKRAKVDHELHFVDASDALCKSRLHDRSKGLPAGTPWTTETDLEAINAYFQPPSEDARGLLQNFFWSDTKCIRNGWPNRVSGSSPGAKNSELLSLNIWEEGGIRNPG